MILNQEFHNLKTPGNKTTLYVEFTYRKVAMKHERLKYVVLNAETVTFIMTVPDQSLFTKKCQAIIILK